MHPRDFFFKPLSCNYRYDTLKYKRLPSMLGGGRIANPLIQAAWNSGLLQQLDPSSRTNALPQRNQGFSLPPPSPILCPQLPQVQGMGDGAVTENKPLQPPRSSQLNCARPVQERGLPTMQRPLLRLCTRAARKAARAVNYISQAASGRSLMVCPLPLPMISKKR